MLSSEVNMIDRNEIDVEFSDNHAHDGVVLDLEHDSPRLLCIVAHNHLVCEPQVLYAIEESGYHIRAKRRERNVKRTPRHVENRIRHVRVAVDTFLLHVKACGQ